MYERLCVWDIPSKFCSHFKVKFKYNAPCICGVVVMAAAAASTYPITTYRTHREYACCVSRGIKGSKTKLCNFIISN